MALKYLPLIVCFLIFLKGAECPERFVEVDGVCYFKKHLDVLQDFIDLNPSINGMQPQDIGYQEWTNNQLTYLYLGENNIATIPDSIGLLKGLINFDLRENQIVSIPEEICNIYPFYTEINLSGNQICPPYPYCFEYISRQNIKECGTFDCPRGYMDVEGECYNKEHVQILQSIIDTNPSLNKLSPLDLGKDIGRLGWENGKLIHLNLVSNGLTSLPESLCSIYGKLEYFDVSNNFICSPYPTCFEFVGYQNTKNCDSPDSASKSDVDNRFVDNLDIVPTNDIANINAKYFQDDLEVLQSFIDNNESLSGHDPLEIGQQQWINMRLESLDLSSLGITYVPEKLCDIYSNLIKFDVSNNEICPPYPRCIDYIGKQKTEFCVNFLCPENYIEINRECYRSEHIAFLEALIDSNAALWKVIPPLSPLNVAKETGLLKWKNGKIDQFVFTGIGLTKIPENICNVFYDISLLNISNNAICPPYPACLEDVGYQNLKNCEIVSHPLLSCPDGYVSFDNKCYYYDDLQVLIDFTKLNPNLEFYHPLLLGYQLWESGRLAQLNLDGWNISDIPKNIQHLDQLEYLNLNNNHLTFLPETLCNILSNLQNFQIDNNLLCPPYLDCFDFIGKQNTENCEHHFCPYGHIDIEEECYYEKDVIVLQDFIKLNKSLNNKNPLEIGIQKWKNMRLDYLYLGINELTVVPESICTIASNLTTLNISQNSVCPPYPGCVEILVGVQNTSSCP